MDMERTDSFNFDVSLTWASQHPSFECRRTGDRLEYLIDGEPYLRVERQGKFALLYKRAPSPRTRPAAGASLLRPGDAGLP